MPTIRPALAVAHRAIWLVALVCATAIAGVPSVASACATCGAGDPTLTQVGVELPYAGRVRVSLVGQRSSYAEGSAASRLEVADYRAILGVAVSPAPWLTLSLFGPLAYREATYANLATDRTFGSSDLDLRARFVVFRDRTIAPSHVLSLQAGLALPTTTPLRDAQGALLPLDAQPGLGAFAPLVGLGYSFFADTLSLHALSTLEVPTEGLGGFRAGPSVRATVMGQWQALRSLAFALGANTRVDLPGGVGATAGEVLFVSPSVSVSPIDALLLWLTVRVPVLQHFTDERREGFVVELGAAVDVS